MKTKIINSFWTGIVRNIGECLGVRMIK